jgi:hypothetical protein
MPAIGCRRNLRLSHTRPRGLSRIDTSDPATTAATLPFREHLEPGWGPCHAIFDSSVNRRDVDTGVNGRNRTSKVLVAVAHPWLMFRSGARLIQYRNSSGCNHLLRTHLLFITTATDHICFFFCALAARFEMPPCSK